MKLNVIASNATEKPWYSDGLAFTCTQCGNCCTGGPGYVWISSEEIRRLAEFLKLSIDETITRHCRRIGKRTSLKEHRTPAGLYDCEFLKEIDAERDVDGQRVRFKKRICTIYPCARCSVARGRSGMDCCKVPKPGTSQAVAVPG